MAPFPRHQGRRYAGRRPPKNEQAPMPTLRTALLLLAASGALQTARSSTYLIKPDGTGDFPTIQAAVDSSADGDEILLADGSFQGEGNTGVDFLGKAITIRSVSGSPSACLLSGNSGAPCDGIKFHSGEGPGSVLADLTIWYPSSAGCGSRPGAIRCDGSSPTLRNVIVEGADPGVIIRGGASPRLEGVQVRYCGGPGMRIWDSAPTLAGCVVESNSYTGSASGAVPGGIHLLGATVTFENCIIRGNTPGGVLVEATTARFDRCVIANNSSWFWWAGGITEDAGSSVTLVGSTVTRNSGPTGGILVEGGALDMSGTILWGDCGYEFPELFSWGTAVTANCCDIQWDGVGIPGTPDTTDVVDMDPLFCAPGPCGPVSGAWSYAVDDGSPLWHMPCGQIGAEAQDCRISVEPTSWGRVKALFR